jgi:hypothetical protein
MTYRYGPWAVRPVALTEPARPVRMGCLPGSDAEHLVVELHGYVVTTVSCPRIGDGSLLDLRPLAAAVPFDLRELVPA